MPTKVLFIESLFSFCSTGSRLVGLLIKKKKPKKNVNKKYLSSFLFSGLCFIGNTEADDSMVKIIEEFPESYQSLFFILIDMCSFAGSGNVLKIRKLLHICSGLKKYYVLESSDESESEDERIENEPVDRRNMAKSQVNVNEKNILIQNEHRSTAVPNISHQAPTNNGGLLVVAEDTFMEQNKLKKPAVTNPPHKTPEGQMVVTNGKPINDTKYESQKMPNPLYQSSCSSDDRVVYTEEITPNQNEHKINGVSNYPSERLMTVGSPVKVTGGMLENHEAHHRKIIAVPNPHYDPIRSANLSIVTDEIFGHPNEHKITVQMNPTHNTTNDVKNSKTSTKYEELSTVYSNVNNCNKRKKRKEKKQVDDQSDINFNQAAAVVGIAVVALGEEVGCEMAYRYVTLFFTLINFPFNLFFFVSFN